MRGSVQGQCHIYMSSYNMVHKNPISHSPGGGYQPYQTSVQQGAYQPQPSRYPPAPAPAPPTATTSGGLPPSYNTSIGFQVGGVMGGAPYPPPPQAGYQTVGANAFGQSGVSSVQN